MYSNELSRKNTNPIVDSNYFRFMRV